MNKAAKKINIAWLFALIASAIALIASYFIYFGDSEAALHKLLNPSWIAILLCGFGIFKKALIGIFKEKKIKSEILICAVVVVLIVSELLSFVDNDPSVEYNYLFLAGMVVFIITCGEFIEDVLFKREIHIKKTITEERGKLERIAEGLSSAVIPSAVVLGVMVLFVSRFLLPQTNENEIPLWNEAVMRGCVVLIAFSPASLAGAASSVINAAIGKIESHNIYIKNGEVFEALSSLEEMCFCTIGVLTDRKLKIKAFYSETDRAELVSLLVALESKDSHPVAFALVKSLGGAYKDKRVEDFCVLPGCGVRGTVEGKEIISAKWDYFNKYSISGEMYVRTQEWLKQGCMVIGVSVNGKLCAGIALADEISKFAEYTVCTFKNLKIRPVLLTGDNAHRAIHVANSVGIEVYRSGLLPENKINFVRMLKKEGKKVAAMSDDINDWQLLSVADIGIVFNNDDNSVNASVGINNIADFPSMLKLSKKTVRLIKATIAIVFAVNICSVALAMFGILSLITASLVHIGLSFMTLIAAHIAQRAF